MSCLVSKSNWCSVTFGEIATLINGRAYKKSELLGAGTPVLRIQNLNGGDRWYFSDLELPKSKYCEKGDLLFAWSASFGPYVWGGPRAIYHYHIWKVIPGPKLDKKFAFHLLNSLTRSVKDAAHGVAMLHITKEKMEAWEIPLPPLAEQKRIAAILDAADALRAKRRESLAQLDTLLQAIFLDMFGDPVTNPKGWEIELLGKICDVRDGTHDSPKYTETGHPLLTSKNFKNGQINYTDANLISDEDFIQINKRSKVDVGDLVMPMIGTIGNPVIVAQEPDFAIKNVALIKFSEKSPDNRFMRALLCSHYFDHITSKANRGGTQKFVALNDLRSMPIPLPTTDLQHHFTTIVESVEQQKTRLRDHLAELDTLFASLQQRAFNGKL